MEKFCKSCGIPMDKPEDFANNNIDSNYCYYCGDKQDYSKEELYKKPSYIKKEEHYKKKEVKLRIKKAKKKPMIKSKKR